VETHEVGSLSWNPPIPFIRLHGLKVLFGLLLLVMVIAFGGAILGRGHSDSPEAVTEDLIRTENQVSDLLAPVHDQATLADCDEQLEELQAHLDKRLAQFQALSDEDRARVGERYGGEMQAASERLKRESQRVAGFAGAH
jgi:hypothetical protein